MLTHSLWARFASFSVLERLHLRQDRISFGPGPPHCGPGQPCFGPGPPCLWAWVTLLGARAALLWVAVELFCKQRITTSTTPTIHSTRNFSPQAPVVLQSDSVWDISIFLPSAPVGEKFSIEGGGFLGDLGRGMGFGRADFFFVEKSSPPPS